MTLDATGGNRARAAELLGVSLRTVRNKVREFGLPPRNDYRNELPAGGLTAHDFPIHRLAINPLAIENGNGKNGNDRNSNKNNNSNNNDNNSNKEPLCP